MISGPLSAQDESPGADRSTQQQVTSPECAPSDGLACWGQTQSNPTDGTGVVLTPRVSNDGPNGQGGGAVRRFGPVVPSTADRAPARAARIDQEASAACMAEQLQRDHENVPGEGPICRSVRLAREASASRSRDTASAAGSFSLSSPTPPTSSGEQERVSRERKCETLPNGSLRCASRSIYSAGTSEGAANEAERRLEDRFDD